MGTFAQSLAVVLACLLALTTGQLNFGKPCEGPQSEIYCHSEFLRTVQLADFYPDQKTFVDRPLKFEPSEVLAKFNELGFSGDNLSDEQRDILEKFLDDNFHPNGTELEDWEPTDWEENPAFLSQIKDEDLRQYGKELNELWHLLGRRIKDDVRENTTRHSMYYVSHPVIFPGGRFKEFYYWDSYWIQRGLLVSNMNSTVKGMIENFMEMVELIGFIPNGGRIYYQRSQPPMLMAMVDGYYEHTQDVQFLRDHIGTMIKEFNFFINKRNATVTIGEKSYEMIRYNVELTEPRPESFKDDYDLVEPLGVTPDEEQEIYANLKTAAESGWDFSSRWYKMKNNGSMIDGNLTDTKTRDIIPVELNSFIYRNAKLLEKFCGLINTPETTVCDPAIYSNKAEEIKTAIHEVLWDEEAGTWFDYDFVDGNKRKQFYPTNLAPLWVQAYHGDINVIARRSVNYLTVSGATNFPGGIPTSMLQTGLQWDFPNGWAPLNHLVIEGLEKTNVPSAQALAFQLAEKWVRSNHLAYLQSEAMFEKYDVSIIGGAGSGGEYDVVIGFGWSNGVILDFLTKYGDRLTPLPGLGTTTPLSTTQSGACVLSSWSMLGPLLYVLLKLWNN